MGGGGAADEAAAGVGSLRRGGWAGWFLLSAVVIALDQFTKLRIMAALDLYERRTVLPFFDLVRLHNTGAAFSLLADASGWQNGLFAVVALGVSVAVCWWIVRLPSRGHTVLALGLALLLGGAIGNLIDRLAHGYVVDFILLHYEDWSYPAFNLADSAISCGVLLVLFDGFVLERRRRRIG